MLSSSEVNLFALGSVIVSESAPDEAVNVKLESVGV